MNLLFLDIETTGLDPDTHEIIDIAMVETDRQGNILTSFTSKVKPNWGCSEEAAKVNGYTKEAWDNAPSWSQVKDMIWDTFSEDIRSKRDLLAVGWNIAFDLNFVRSTLNNACGMNISYHGLDLMGVGWQMICGLVENGHQKYEVKGLIDIVDRKPHLSDLCKLLGVEVKNAHTAMGDVMMYIECYKRML